METLKEATMKKQLVRVRSGNAASVAKLLPVKRSQDSLSLGLDEKRYVRIAKSGKTDLNGGVNGPWTEFKVEPHDDAEFSLRGVKSGRWLSVIDGEFISSEEPEPLFVELAGAAHGPEKCATTNDESNSISATAPGVDLDEPVVLADGKNTFQWPVRLERTARHVYLVTSRENFACDANGNFHKNGKRGQWAQWVMEETSSGASFFNVGHSKYLALDPKGAPVLSDTSVSFTVASPPSPSTLPVDHAVLSAVDVACFKEQGFVVVRNVVPPESVRNASRSINHQLGKPDCWQVDSDPLNAGQVMLRVSGKEVGAEIFNRSPVFWSACNILLGEGNVKPWRSGLQVALRFPQPLEAGFHVPDERPDTGTRYHIDGMGQNRLCPFSLLCGVALSDQMQPNMGNLNVFPGSHLNEDLHKYYRERINDDNQNEMDTNKPDLGKPEQVLLRAGDVVIAHQLLAHRVGSNTSEHIRYQLYYRVQHKDHDELREKVIDDPWSEFAI